MEATIIGEGTGLKQLQALHIRWKELNVALCHKPWIKTCVLKQVIYLFIYFPQNNSITVEQLSGYYDNGATKEVISFSLSPQHFDLVMSEMEDGHCCPEYYVQKWSCRVKKENKRKKKERTIFS